MTGATQRGRSYEIVTRHGSLFYASRRYRYAVYIDRWVYDGQRTIGEADLIIGTNDLQTATYTRRRRQVEFRGIIRRPYSWEVCIYDLRGGKLVP